MCVQVLVPVGDISPGKFDHFATMVMQYRQVGIHLVTLTISFRVSYMVILYYAGGTDKCQVILQGCTEISIPVFSMEDGQYEFSISTGRCGF